MSSDIAEGFVRQRRNLIVMSVVVFFAQYVGLDFKTISFLGNTADITDTGSVMSFLWILLVYWLARYIGYFYDLGDKDIKAALYRRRTMLIGRAFLNKSVPRLARNELEGKYPLLASKKVRHKVTVSGATPTLWSLFSLEVDKRYLIKSLDSGAENRFSITTEIPFIKVVILNIWTLLGIIFLTRLFTEYLLPFVLFLLPVSYLIYQTWPVAF